MIWNNYIYNEAKDIIEELEPYYKKKAGIDSNEVLELLNLIFDENYKVPEMPKDWPIKCCCLVTWE